MKKENKENIIYSSTGQPLIFDVSSSYGVCMYGHCWTYVGSLQHIPEGTYCDCGQVKYESPKYCDKCGHQL